MLSLLLVLSIFGCGGMLLILILGAQSIEIQDFEQRTRQRAHSSAPGGCTPQWVKVGQPPAASASRFDDAFVLEVRKYVATEQTLADEFISQPSVASLYRDADTRITGNFGTTSTTKRRQS